MVRSYPGSRPGQRRPKFRRFRTMGKNTVRKAVFAKRKSNFKKNVLAVMKTQVERKLHNFNLFNSQPILGTGLSYDATNLIYHGAKVNYLGATNSLVTQGTGNNQRIGNQITDVKMSFRGVIMSNVYSIHTNNHHVPFEVWCVVYKRKNDKLGNPDKLKILADASGNSSEGELDGGGISTVSPWNTNSYVIKKVKSWKMRCHPEHTAAGATTPLLNPNTSSDGKLMQRFNFTIPLAKTLKYIDNSSTPQNDFGTVAFYVVNSDGHPLPSTQMRARVTADATITYSDA